MKEFFLSLAVLLLSFYMGYTYGHVVAAMEFLSPPAETALPQDAEVVDLSDADAAESKSRHEAFAATMLSSEEQRTKIKEKYLVVACIIDLKYPNPDAGGMAGPPNRNRCYRKGFENGFQFSKDFKHIFPDLRPGPTSIFDCWKVRPGAR